MRKKEMTLAQVVDYIADIVVRRADAGKNFGVALIPEGLIEFIPEIEELILELNDTLTRYKDEMEDIKEKRTNLFLKNLAANIRV